MRYVYEKRPAYVPMKPCPKHIEDVKGIQIFDIEVFAHDWVVVSYDIDNDKYNVFHNDSEGVRDWLKRDNPILMGFNNNLYDNYILLSMIKGNSPEMVKELNDYIIERDDNGNKRMGWNHYSIRGMKTWEHLGRGAGDLRWDMPFNVSLKRIEGNLGLDIRESGVDFKIQRKLKPDELEEVITYCKADVKSTYELFKMRKEYLETKLAVGELWNRSPEFVLTKNNVKLVSQFLYARKLPDPRRDEFVYKIPDNVKLGKYEEGIRNFFEHGYENIQKEHPELDGEELIKEIYRTTHTFMMGDMEVRLAWGGIHAAEKNSEYVSDENRKVVDIDVGSYYPSIMLEYDLLSSSLNKMSRDKFANIYETRLEEKHKGNNERAAAMKLILNTTYGAMKYKFSDMYEPRAANGVCITGQVMLVDLMEKLEHVNGVRLIQANTDGIIFDYDRKQEKKVQEVVSEWEERTGMHMEYTDIKRIVQKNVNNYAMVSGETYLFRDGEKIVTKEDKDKEVFKGKWMKPTEMDSGSCQYPILATALRENVLRGTPVEETVRNCKDISQFQYVFQPAGTDVSCEAYIDGIRHDIQRTNRIYAVKDEKYGQVRIVSANYESRLVAECPPHAKVDNENKIKLEELDFDWYVQKAKERLKSYQVDKGMTDDFTVDLRPEDINMDISKPKEMKR